MGQRGPDAHSNAQQGAARQESGRIPAREPSTHPHRSRDRSGWRLGRHGAGEARKGLIELEWRLGGQVFRLRGPALGAVITGRGGMVAPLALAVQPRVEAPVAMRWVAMAPVIGARGVRVCGLLHRVQRYLRAVTARRGLQTQERGEQKAGDRWAHQYVLPHHLRQCRSDRLMTLLAKPVRARSELRPAGAGPRKCGSPRANSLGEPQKSTDTG